MRQYETTIEHTWWLPAWLAVLIAVALIAAMVYLYRRETVYLKNSIRLALLAARLTVCGIVLWMLGGWQIQRHRIEPPELIVAIDKSASMSFLDRYDDGDAKRTISRWIEKPTSGQAATGLRRFDIAKNLLFDRRNGIFESLQERFDVKFYWVAEGAEQVLPTQMRALSSEKANGKASKLGDSIRTLVSQQETAPTAALLIYTDGVTTGGSSLQAAAESAAGHGVPLYLVGVGNERRPRDVRLADLIADDVAFAGDAVPFDVQLLASSAKGEEVSVQLKRTDSGETLSEETVTIDDDTDRKSVRLTFRPESVGTVPLTISAVPLAGESDRTNNRLNHELHVNDATLRVLMVQAYPSYEFRYLKNLLSRATRASDPSLKSFELTTVLQEADPEHGDQDPTAVPVFPVTLDELSEFDVVIFGDVDPRLLGRSAIENLTTFVRDQGKGIVMIAGPRFNPLGYLDTPLAELFPFSKTDISAAGNPPHEVPFAAKLTAVGALTPTSQLRIGRSENLAVWSKLPDLFWHMEIQECHPGVRVLVEHTTRDSNSAASFPLITHHFVGSGRVVFHATDETYRWARFQEGDEYYSRYWLQTLRSLGRSKLLAGQSSAEISTDRQQYLPGDSVQVRIRFRDGRPGLDSVSATIEEKGGVRRDISLRRTEAVLATFTASVSDLTPGSYRVWLTSPLLAPAPSPRTFSIAAEVQEQVGVPLNADELQLAAKISRGRYYHWYETERLLRDLPRGQRLRIESLPPEPIWNSPWVAGLCVLLLTVEWLLRKKYGLL